ncbi:MAG: response regulator transcription factor [Prevotella sp.]|nr:response regulator transcription factor [Bacteroides sp.]MCM1366144.1 response regulator transcription factor [Prevotella sp.]MCM1436791.1 response regulator transcription factor [Prevotella sp.]
MNNLPRFHVVIASPSPIIAGGLAYTLRKITDMQISSSEASSYQDLIDQCHRNNTQIAIVSPAFDGIFNPDNFHKDAPEGVKLVAINAGAMHQNTNRLFDQTISIVDDIPTIANKISQLIQDPQEQQKNKDQLSQREKEIIKHVVKGLTNKEIADKLFISVNTVITHRRNIARKLEIHSATGLTIYAIVNNIVDITDIKL